jgi:hypothetical protein
MDCGNDGVSPQVNQVSVSGGDSGNANAAILITIQIALGVWVRLRPLSSLAIRHFPFVFIHLRTLYLSLRSFFSSPSLFSTACKLFLQNTRGVGTSLRSAFGIANSPTTLSAFPEGEGEE